MHFGLSEEQILLQDTVRRYFSDRLDIDAIKAMLDKPCPEDIWNSVVDMGLAGVIVPEDQGGSNLSMMDAMVVAEAVGRFVSPVPLAGALIATGVITRYGSTEQKERYLSGIASGTVRMAYGLDASHSGIAVEGGKCSGRSAFMVDVSGATHYLLITSHALVIFEDGDPGIRIDPLQNVDRTRSFAQVSFDRARCELVGAGDVSAARMALAIGRLFLSLDTFGAAEKMFEDAQRYSLERFQFDRPIGSFQSIKHQLSDMICDLEPCRSLLWYAAHTYDAEPEEFELHCCFAKSLVTEAAKRVAKTSLEIHGGMGYTELLGLHLWFKRIETNRQLLGGPRSVRARAAEIQGFISEEGS